MLTFSVHAQADMASMQAYMYFKIFMSLVSIEWWCEVIIFASDGQGGNSSGEHGVPAAEKIVVLMSLVVFDHTPEAG